MKLLKSKKRSAMLTRMIISLHAKGYTEEFCIKGTPAMICMVTDPELVIPYYDILLINQVFDELTGRYKYIHAIESESGQRGLLLDDICLFHRSALSELPEREVFIN
jgi:hypothetical protein